MVRASLLGLGIACLAASSASASITLLSGPSAATHVGNLVTNGSFEVGAPPVNGSTLYWATGTTNTPFAVPAGWTSSGNPGTYASWGNDGAGAPRLEQSAVLPDGRNALYFGNLLTSVNKVPTWQPNGRVTFPSAPTFTPGLGGPVTLSQTVPTDTNPAPSYLLSFWVSGEEASIGSWADGIFGLKVTNVLASDPTQYFAVPGGLSGLGASHRFDFSFVPINSSLPVTIEFINYGHITSWPGSNGFTSELVLDDVIVNAVPAPGVGGLVALGALLPSRRRH